MTKLQLVQHLKNKYPIPRIRRALIVLHDVPLKEAAIELGVTDSAISRVVSGRSRSETIGQWLCDRLKLPLAELFPDSRIPPGKEKNNKKSKGKTSKAIK